MAGDAQDESKAMLSSGASGPVMVKQFWPSFRLSGSRIPRCTAVAADAAPPDKCASTMRSLLGDDAAEALRTARLLFTARSKLATASVGTPTNFSRTALGLKSKYCKK